MVDTQEQISDRLRRVDASLEHEFAELRRVSQRTFGGWEAETDLRVVYDLSVLKRPAYKS